MFLVLYPFQPSQLAHRSVHVQVVDAIKDLVQDCNFDCNDSGIALQAMDNSHVALVSMMLKAEGFSPYRCDRNIALGVNLTSLTKVLRAAQNEDILTLKAEDAPDVLNLVFESSENDRISEYDLKLMDIDQEHLGIPETEYASTIAMPASEFRRICTDLAAMSESVSIEASKDGVKFACNGDIGNGSVTLRSHTNVEKPELNVDIELTEPVSLTFSLKYLVNFCKAAALSTQVKICLSNEVPLLVEYNLSGSSYLRFYLAPKVGSLQLTHVVLSKDAFANDELNRLVTRSNVIPASKRRHSLGKVMTLRVFGVDLRVWNEGIFSTKKRGQYCVAGGVRDPRFACIFRHLLHLNYRSNTTEPVFIGQADIESFRTLLYRWISI